MAGELLSAPRKRSMFNVSLRTVFEPAALEVPEGHETLRTIGDCVSFAARGNPLADSQFYSTRAVPARRPFETTMDHSGRRP
jgi:hypothetical protein